MCGTKKGLSRGQRGGRENRRREAAVLALHNNLLLLSMIIIPSTDCKDTPTRQSKTGRSTHKVHVIANDHQFQVPAHLIAFHHRHLDPPRNVLIYFLLLSLAGLGSG